jgi:hypothetical protein
MVNATAHHEAVQRERIPPRTQDRYLVVQSGDEADAECYR